MAPGGGLEDEFPGRHPSDGFPESCAADDVVMLVVVVMLMMVVLVVLVMMVVMRVMCVMVAM